MSIVSEIKKQFKENDAAVLKKFGQNFLVSQTVLTKIIAAADLKPQDTVLEIGPGLGALTFELAKKAKKVIAVEKDKKIAQMLKKNLVEKGISNVKVINQDVLRLPVSRDPTSSQNLSPSPWEVGSLLADPYCVIQNYKLIANLPYNIATAVIMKFLEAEKPPTLMVVMVQKEVSQRICAKPPHMNKLAVFCQIYSQPKIISYVSSSAFWPKPKVDSAILELRSLPTRSEAPFTSHFQGSQATLENLCSLATLVNAGFSHPRKTLLNNFFKKTEGPSFHWLSKEKISEWLKANNINPMQRPETLSVENWQNLAKTSVKVLIHS